MPTYKFEAMDATGQEIKDVIESPSQEEAQATIRQMGYFITKISVQKGKQAATKGVGKKRKTFAIGGAKSKDICTFTRQLSILQDAGLPILRSLRILEGQSKPGALKNALIDTCDEIESGSTLSESMAKNPKVFNRLYVNMIKAGEAGGILDTILQRLADFMEKAQRLKKKVIGAMIYPIIVMSVAVMILTGIMIFVIPAFEKMFKEQGMSLHWMTASLIFVSHALVSWYGIVIAIAVAAAGFGMLAWGRTDAGQRVTDRIKLRVPIFGNIIRKAVTARFTRTLGTLVQAGVPILEALNICKNAIGNVILGEAIDKVASSIKEGESIAGPLGETGLFDPLVVNMIDVGEETGELDKMLIKVADTFDVYVDIAVESLISILEPVLIVFMGGAIGFIVIALFLPLVGLIDAIGGK